MVQWDHDRIFPCHDSDVSTTYEDSLDLIPAFTFLFVPVVVEALAVTLAFD
jgi:hypothetical protein